jgi:hypothetical protein
MNSTIWARLQNAIRCWIGLHHIPPTHAVMEMGAVFVGGLCTRCYKVKVGPFLCNSWNDSLTEKVNGVQCLKGVNPILLKRNYFVMDLETLEEISRNRRSKKRGETD